MLEFIEERIQTGCLDFVRGTDRAPLRFPLIPKIGFDALAFFVLICDDPIEIVMREIVQEYFYLIHRDDYEFHF